MKYLAAEADARWEAKPRMMDAPGEVNGQPVPALESRSGGDAAAAAVTAKNRGQQAGETRSDHIASAEDQVGASKIPPPQEPKKSQKVEDPWKKHRPAGPSETWQPQGWNPTSSRR